MDYEQLPSLPMGVRFRPNQQELLLYLKHKLAGEPLGNDPIADVDVYGSEPGDLPSKSKLKKEARKWYFYSRLDKKYGKKSSKINRETSKGQWKITAPDVKVCYNSRTSGFSGTRKVLTFYSRQGGGLVRTNWGMHEYSLGDKESYGNSHVLCKIFRKPHDEAVGEEAPSGEAGREHDDVTVVAPGETPPTGVAVGDGGYAEAANLSQDVNHSGGTGETSELHPDPKFVHIPEQHGMDAEPWTNGFIEAHDLANPMEADSACLGPANNPDLYFDLSELLGPEDSRPHDSQMDVESWVFVEDYQQPKIGTSQASELHPDEKNVRDQEQYGMVAKPLKDKYFVESSDCTNAFDNEDPVYVGLADDPDMHLDLYEIFVTEITGSSVALENEIEGADQMSEENISACFDIREFLNLDGCSDMDLSLSEISGTENVRPPAPQQNEIVGANQVSEAKMDESGGKRHKHA